MQIKLACCVMALVAVSAVQSHAQRPAHYYPARPTFSTYLLYRQFNGTGIPNYYQYVRPATQFRDYVNNVPLSPAAGRRTTQILDIEQQVERALETTLRQRPTTGIGEVSVPAQFGNTLQFYQRPPVTRR